MKKLSLFLHIGEKTSPQSSISCKDVSLKCAADRDISLHRNNLPNPLIGQQSCFVEKEVKSCCHMHVCTAMHCVFKVIKLVIIPWSNYSESMYESMKVYAWQLATRPQDLWSCYVYLLPKVREHTRFNQIETELVNFSLVRPVFLNFFILGSLALFKSNLVAPLATIYP